jgi:hypothetical protein
MLDVGSRFPVQGIRAASFYGQAVVTTGTAGAET